MSTFRERNLFPGLVIISLFMVVIGLYAYDIPEQQKRKGQWVMHTLEVQNQLETLSKHLTTAETSQRGYLLTGQPVYLAAYAPAIQSIDKDLLRLRQLTNDNAIQQAQLPGLQANIAAKVTEFQGTIDLRRSQGLDAALRADLPERGRTQMEAIQQQIGQMQSEEQNLLKQRRANRERAAAFTRMTFVGGLILLYVLLCLLYAVMKKQFLHRKRLLDVERHATEAQREETRRLAQVVALQTDVASARQELQAAMQTITEGTQEITRAEGAVVELLEGDEMVYRAAGGIVAPHLGLRLKAATSLSGRCVRENVLFKCDDSEEDDRVDRAACRKIGLRSMVVVPLRHSGQAIGVLKVMSSRVAAFTTQDVATLELMAGVLAAALSDATATQILRESQERLEKAQRETQTANEWLVEANAILETQAAELESANARLEALATTDGLTGIKNHRAFQERLAEEFQRALRHNTPLSVVLLDVDHFKRFNDTFGHPEGDAALRRVAEIIQAIARTTDLVARYGGEEFVLLLPTTDAQAAIATAKRIRQTIAQATWKLRTITVSVGAASLSLETDTGQKLVDLADQALYYSKRHGRDQVTHANELTLIVSAPNDNLMALQAH